MNTYHTLSAEKKELEEILSAIPAEDVIERASFEARLARVDRELSSLVPPIPVKKATLTFRGNPVRGSRAISADFSAKVTRLFNDAVAAIAAGLAGELNYKGRITGKRTNELFITGTAIGSFGFEYEVPERSIEGGSTHEISAAANALDHLLSLIEITAVGDDDALAEVVDEIHPRAVKKVAEMLEFTAREKAWLGLSFGKRSYKYRDLDQFENAVKRVRGANIKEGKAVFEGVFQGFLPESRRFEFRCKDKKNLVSGRFSPKIDKPLSLNVWIDKEVEVTLHSIQVGQGIPKYTLISAADIILKKG